MQRKIPSAVIFHVLKLVSFNLMAAAILFKLESRLSLLSLNCSFHDKSLVIWQPNNIALSLEVFIRACSYNALQFRTQGLMIGKWVYESLSLGLLSVISVIQN